MIKNNDIWSKLEVSIFQCRPTLDSKLLNKCLENIQNPLDGKKNIIDYVIPFDIYLIPFKICARIILTN